MWLQCVHKSVWWRRVFCVTVSAVDALLPLCVLFFWSNAAFLF